MAKIEDALNDCIERMADGELLDDCLASYPDLADELKPLLVMSQTVTDSTAAIKPRPEFKAEARYKFHAALAAKEKKTAKAAPLRRRWSLRWATIALAVLIVFVVGGTTGVASADSVPGEPLYRVKTFVERVQMGITIGADRRANLHVKFAERRSNEMQTMVNQGNLEEANNLGVRLINHLTQAKLAAPLILESEDIVTRLETLANRQVALLEIIYDKAPEGAQGSIETLINSINNAYEAAIEEIAVALPAVQLLVSGNVAASGERLTGTIQITNNSDFDAQVDKVKYTLFYATGTDDNLLQAARIIKPKQNTLGGLEVGSVISAQWADSFYYSVNFAVPDNAIKIRGIVSIKLAGRNLWYYDIAEFRMPSLHSVGS
ncbi:DUF5667 domain-containing protein [Chloroflexota bacterium]